LRFPAASAARSRSRRSRLRCSFSSWRLDIGGEA
jgi:hypothetical protein